MSYSNVSRAKVGLGGSGCKWQRWMKRANRGLLWGWHYENSMASLCRKKADRRANEGALTWCPRGIGGGWVNNPNPQPTPGRSHLASDSNLNGVCKIPGKDALLTCAVTSHFYGNGAKFICLNGLWEDFPLTLRWLSHWQGEKWVTRGLNCGLKEGMAVCGNLGPLSAGRRI